MFRAALAILLIGLSSMEPGSKKGPIGTFSHCCLWPRAGSQRQTNTSSQGCTQSSLAIPALNLSPQVRSLWRWRTRRLCFRALAQKCDRAGRWWSVWAERDSLWGFCPQCPSCSVFLGQRNSGALASACLAPTALGLPGSTSETAAWSERPLVATVQMIVTCATRQKQMCLVEGLG